MTNMLENEQGCSLLCTEILDVSELKTPEKSHIRQSHFPELMEEEQEAQQLQQQQQHMESMLPPTVRAIEDFGQLKDARILQNLLRNEDKFLPHVNNYLVNVQQTGITPDMRKTVADWMLEVIREQFSQPEVFCLAVNIMDRFLCHCQIHKSQLQLVASVCILIASKIREPCPIPGKTLIIYTDCSITANELKEWELLILYKLQWELTAITSIDYLDHTLPRLGLDDITQRHGLEAIEATELRRRTETILVLVATDYQFCYHNPSLLAASAILTALQSMSVDNEKVLREIRLRLQTATHTATNHINTCVQAINLMLPGYLKPLIEDPISEVASDVPDSTSSPVKSPQTCPSPPPSLPFTTAPQRSPEPDLHCEEDLSNDCQLTEEFSNDECCLSPGDEKHRDSRTSSPLSAVDIFNEFDDSDVLQVMFEQNDSPFSILVS